MIQVKYEYQPGRFAFGQITDDDMDARSVKVSWTTRRRHLAGQTVDRVKLVVRKADRLLYDKRKAAREAAAAAKAQRAEVPA